MDFLAYLNIGQTVFEKKVGISNGYVNNVKNSIGSEIISKISSVYPELSTEWLLTGKGGMLKKNVQKNDVDNNNGIVGIQGEGHNITNNANGDFNKLIEIQQYYHKILEKKDANLDKIICDNLKKDDIIIEKDAQIKMLLEQIQKGGERIDKLIEIIEKAHK